MDPGRTETPAGPNVDVRGERQAAGPLGGKDPAGAGPGWASGTVASSAPPGQAHPSPKGGPAKPSTRGTEGRNGPSADSSSPRPLRRHHRRRRRLAPTADTAASPRARPLPRRRDSRAPPAAGLPPTAPSFAAATEVPGPRDSLGRERSRAAAAAGLLLRGLRLDPVGVTTHARPQRPPARASAQPQTSAQPRARSGRTERGLRAMGHGFGSSAALA